MTKGTSKKSPRIQKAGGPAVFDQPSNPSFGDFVAPRRIGGKTVVMAEEPKPSRLTKNTMASFSTKPQAPAKRTEPGDQQPPKNDLRSAASGSESGSGSGSGYLRLLLRVVDGEARLRGAKFVPGPLDRPTTISAGLSYVATVGDRQIGVGAVPEFAERRSFPDPSGRSGMERHHVTEIEAPEFTVRIPADAMSEGQLADLRVDLLRWRGRGPGDHIAVSELSRQPKAAVTLVAQLAGVDPADLPAPVRRQLGAAFTRRS